MLRNRGDDAGAAQILVAAEDARYSQYGIARPAASEFIKWTIGYGHRPMLALLWSLGVVLIGSASVSIGKRAGVMAPAWPENKPPDARVVRGIAAATLLARRVPAVRQPGPGTLLVAGCDGDGRISVLGRHITVHGRALRYYLWLQIVAGWLLSAIFIAGITGLLRND